MNEEKIIKKCLAGDSEAFGELFEAYADKIYNFIYYKTHHKQTAEDILSQTFLKAFENLGKFNPQKGGFSSWIYRIARNNVIDHYRASSRKEYSFDADAWDIEDGVNLEEDADNKEKIKLLKKYLTKLSPEHRDIVIMRVWQELSYKEIAEIVGKTPENCKVIFSRSLVRLKKEMPLATLIYFLLNF